jgi:hypothetical protein
MLSMPHSEEKAKSLRGPALGKFPSRFPLPPETSDFGSWPLSH